MDEQERLGLANEIANALISQTKELKEQSIERSKIRSLARETVKLAEEQAIFDQESLSTQEGLDAVLKKQAQTQKTQERVRLQINTLDVKDKKLKEELLKNLQDQEEELEKINKSFQKQVELGEKVQQNFGVKTMSALEDIATKIPGLRKFSGPFKEASQSARKQALHLAKGGKGMSALAKGAGTLLKRMGPLALLGAVISLVKMLFEADKAVGDLAKNLNITYDQALGLRQEFFAISRLSGETFVNAKGLQESFTTISSMLGTGGSTVKGSEELLTTFTKLREMTGLNNEQLMGMASVTLSTGTNLEKNTKEFLGTAEAIGTSNGVLLNTKALMGDISKLSAATTLSVGAQSGEIANVLATTKSLGFELNRIEAIQSFVLDFESSIAAELEAEVLLGKDINLNKAREAALNNDLATVAEEIAKQAGTSAEFAKMNFIQQEAIAKAVGMNREDLAKTLFIQDQLKGFSKEEAKEKQKILEKSIQTLGIDQAREKLGEKGFAALEKQVSTQETFNATMEKFKEILTANEDVILQFAQTLMNAVQNIGVLLSKFSQSGFAKFIGLDFSMQQTNLDIPTKNINDGVITPTNGLVVSSGAGSINLASNDSIVGNKNGIIAGTNLFDISPLVTEMQQMRAIMAQILSKDTNVYLDADKVGTSFNINTVSIQ